MSDIHRILPEYNMKAPFVVMRNGWSRRHVTLYCFSFLLDNCRCLYACFALIALVAYSALR